MKNFLSMMKDAKNDTKYLLEEVKKKDEEIASLNQTIDELEAANTMADEVYDSIRCIVDDLIEQRDTARSLCECIYASLQYGDPNAFKSPDSYRCYMLNLIKPLLDLLKKDIENTDN